MKNIVFKELLRHSKRFEINSFDLGGGIIFRQANFSDISQIEKMEKDVWGDSGANRLQIEKRIEIFPAGNFLALVDGEIAIYLSYQRIKNLPESFSWNEISDNGFIEKSHCDDGQIVYGINLSANNFAFSRGVMQVFLNILAFKEFLSNGINSFYLGARIPGFSDYKKDNPLVSAEEYVLKGRDPELKVYKRYGFQVVKVLPNYFKDQDSCDFGVLMKKNTHCF